MCVVAGRFLWGATEDTGEVGGEVLDVLRSGVDDANVTENLSRQQPVDVVEVIMHAREVAVGHCELDQRSRRDQISVEIEQA